MKLYLSSIRIPMPNELARLLGKPLNDVSVALIPNAKDYYSERARNFKVNNLISYMEQLELEVTVVDLRDYSEGDKLKKKLAEFDLIWAVGGNTFVLRYEMKRSGFDSIIKSLLEDGIVYGGDSAGALVAGLSLAGIEAADEPEFAEELIKDGISLVPFNILPHVDAPGLTDVLPTFRALHQDENIIELKDSQAVIFEDGAHYIISVDK